MKRATAALSIAVCLVMFAAAACSSSKSAARTIDDASIHTALKAKLTADRFSNITNIDINVTNGVVTLAGEVPNAQLKSEAEHEARTTDGVVKVINNLQVKNPPKP